ncbi:hypothetical protein S40293_11328 [Stachybotrys chartarum IBT 40293]|nr:hypothetical protein S40293_11328 [Stachybotrys chartarum IBT 40293]
MPPKRKALASTNANANAGGRKVARKGSPHEITDAELEDRVGDKLLESNLRHTKDRWAKVSGSKNLYTTFLTRYKNRRYACEFMCVCNPLKLSEDLESEDDVHSEDSEQDDNSTNDEAGDASPTETQACDQGKTCPCTKPASELPDHPYTMTRAGLGRGALANALLDLRDPDAFLLHTFKYHMTYGALEVVQNLFLDFDLAFGGMEVCETWPIIEGLALFMLVGGGRIMCESDDQEMVQKTVDQIARMVLSGFALVEHRNQVKSAKNAGWVVSLYAEFAKQMRQADLMEEHHMGKTKAFKFRAGNLDLYLRTYAKRWGFTIPDAVDDSLDLDQLTLPSSTGRDPWGWKRTFPGYAGYCSAPLYAFRGEKRQGIGGDGLDVTSWTKAERKRVTYGGKEFDSVESQIATMLSST